MQIQVNGRYLVQRVTGVQRYAREIVSRLGDKVDVIAPRGQEKGVRGHLWEQAILPCRMRDGLLWSPSNTGPLAVRSQVVTIHDTAFVDHAECVRRSFAAWYQWLVPRLARQARAIITVSNFSAQRIAEYCRVDSGKVHVVSSGVDSRFQPADDGQITAVREQFGLPERYCLCVCSLEPRKNLRRLLDAWRIVAPQVEGHQLVIVGTPGHVFQSAGLGELPLGVKLCGYVDDRWLPALYAGGTCFVFPSLYEGFGLPVLEAMACGTPVVCSRSTALPEVAGDAALFVDPFDVESIAHGLVQLLSSSDLQACLRRRGLERARQFTWENTARETWNVLAQTRQMA